MNEDAYLDTYWENRFEPAFEADFFYPEEDYWYEVEDSDDLPDWAI